MIVVAFLTDPYIALKILRLLGLPSRAQRHERGSEGWSLPYRRLHECGEGRRRGRSAFGRGRESAPGRIERWNHLEIRDGAPLYSMTRDREEGDRCLRDLTGPISMIQPPRLRTDLAS